MLRANPFPLPDTMPATVDPVGMSEQLVDLGGKGVKAVFQLRLFSWG